ncbi:10768_t:CDS:2 [Paraglomus occultum]|uniref:10768_t:CDS:1 n=1 Tax=Paraglomus occultum TaxID=144539 RepID=A0A9N9CNN4_9GLOM|nr:10768_t:CDS:2 [Paraglomus occultum]
MSLNGSQLSNSYTVTTRIRKFSDIQIQSDPFGRVSLNSAIRATCGSDERLGSLSFISSANNKYFASFLVMQESTNVKITVYRFEHNQIHLHWQYDCPLSETGTYKANVTPDSWNSLKLEGHLMNSGEELFLLVSQDYSNCARLFIKNKGAVMTWIRSKRKEWASRWEDYQFSDDECYMYIVCSGKRSVTGSNYIVGAYSTATWELVKEWYIVCHTGNQIPHVKLMGPLYFDNLYLAVSGNNLDSCVVRGLHNDVLLTLPIGDVFSYGSTQSVWVSRDGKQLVNVPKDQARLYYWDLINPTYRPLQECLLLGVEYRPRVVIPRQEHLCRYSPNGEIITIVTANNRVVNVQIMLSWNLQVIDQMDIPYAVFDGYQVWSVGMSNAGDLLVLGTILPRSTGSIQVVISQISGIYDRVHRIEQYFDVASKGVLTDNRVLFSRWELIGSYSDWSMTLKQESSESRPPSSTDIVEIRNGLYELVFLSCNWYNPGTSLELDAADKITHLLTFTVPWDTTNNVYVFAIKIGTTLAVTAIQYKGNRVLADKSRILYYNHNIASQNHNLEIVNCGSYYMLTVEAHGHLSSYSGIVHASKVSIVITNFNIKCDAKYDLFAIHDSRNMNIKGLIISPNMIVTKTSTFLGYIPNLMLNLDAENGSLCFGNRRRGIYSASKLDMWLTYTQRDRHNDIILGPGQFTDIISSHYTAVFDDMDYDDNNWPFPCVFAGAIALDAISVNTTLTDEFLKCYHKSNELILKNTVTITYCIPAACHIRPLGVQSFLRHITLWTMNVEERLVSLHRNKYWKRITNNSNYWEKIMNNYQYWERTPSNYWKIIGFYMLLFCLSPIFIWRFFQKTSHKTLPNTTKCTLPLAGFCSYNKHKVFKPPITHGRLRSDNQKGVFNDLVNCTLGSASFGYSGITIKPHHSHAESPFSCLIDEILALSDENVQYDFFEILWLKKLLTWKLDTFIRKKHFERLLIPTIVNFVLHLLNGLFLTQGNQSNIQIRTKIIATLQCIVVIYLGVQELRQMRTQVRYWKSLFNYFDFSTIGLALGMIICVFIDKQPPVSFIAFSTAIIWVNMILQFRFYKPIGILLAVLTDMIKGVSWFLGLLATLLLGFGFIPFFLLRLKTSVNGDFGSTLFKMIEFLGNDFTSLQPWGNDISISIVRSLFTIIISVLLLNVLIALLNLQVESSSKKGEAKWFKQVAEMVVDIEKYYLTSAERSRPEWFPTWFKYTVTEDEKSEWKKHLEVKGKEWPLSSTSVKTGAEDKMKVLEKSINEIKSMINEMYAEIHKVKAAIDKEPQTSNTESDQVQEEEVESESEI